jgi:hypothetical protein
MQAFGRNQKHQTRMSNIEQGISNEEVSTTGKAGGLISP